MEIGVPTFDETWVYTERVIAYWSRVLKSAERNYSSTEREALALKEGLIKFQPYIEGGTILAVADHATLTWSKTFQNISGYLHGEQYFQLILSFELFTEQGECIQMLILSQDSKGDHHIRKDQLLMEFNIFLLN